MHVVLLLLLSLITLAGRAQGTAPPEVQTLIDDGPDLKANLIDDQIGLNPGVLLNYNINRIEDVAVPGPALPNDPVGLKDAPAALPVDIPPPPGLGGSMGQGGGLDFTKPDATASSIGAAGGMGGINVPGGFGGRSGATKEKLLLEGGGNTASEAAVAAGQKWLVNHQAEDGHWSLDGFDQHVGGPLQLHRVRPAQRYRRHGAGAFALARSRRNAPQPTLDLQVERRKSPSLPDEEAGAQRLFRRRRLRARAWPPSPSAKPTA